MYLRAVQAFTNIKIKNLSKYYTLTSEWTCNCELNLTQWRLNMTNFWRKGVSLEMEAGGNLWAICYSSVLEGAGRKMLSQAGGFGGDECPTIDGRVDDLQA